MKTIVVDDGDALIIRRRFDNKELARIEIIDNLIPRGEQVLRTYAIIFSKRWRMLGADADTGNNTVSIQLCTED